jgi:DNA polymerase I-like protein with 3'-5' exonuclease and polymerase domains
VANRALLLGYSTTTGGRRRVFQVLPPPERGQFTSWDGFKAALEAHRITESTIRRQAVNATIQGTGADIMKLALILAFRRLPIDAPGAHLVAAVHDELIVETPLVCADAAARVLEDAMRNAATAYLPTVAIGELKAEPSPYWKKS